MIDYADKDRDGVINYDEFINIITKEYPKIWWLYKHRYHFKFLLLSQFLISPLITSLHKFKLIFTISIVEKTAPFLFLSRLKFLFHVLYHEIELLSDVLHLLVLLEDLVLHTEYEITMHLISLFSVKPQNLFGCWLTLKLNHQIHYRLFLACHFI